MHQYSIFFSPDMIEWGKIQFLLCSRKAFHILHRIRGKDQQSNLGNILFLITPIEFDKQMVSYPRIYALSIANDVTIMMENRDTHTYIYMTGRSVQLEANYRRLMLQKVHQFIVI